MAKKNNEMKNNRFVMATIDLGAHSARMLIAEIHRDTRKIEPLEELDILIPLGSNVFQRGRASNETIEMLCDIFRNFRQKMSEYGVMTYKAIATSAVREAMNSEVLIERIQHATGICLQIFEGTDEARLDYLTVINDVPEKYAFKTKSTLIADIGTGACQVSSYECDRLCFTETIKVGTLRVLELMPDTVSTAAIMQYLTPVIDKSFSELEHIASSLKSEYIIAMGSSVRLLVSLYRKPRKNQQTVSLDKLEFEEMYALVSSLSIERISEQYEIPQDLAEAVIPCCIILDNLFRITGAAMLLVPLSSTKYGLLQDYMNELLPGGRDYFDKQIFEMVKMTASKYRCDNAYTQRVVAFSTVLFEKLQVLHGLPKRALLLLKIAAHLHKSGLFINNQGYHKHSYYIILNTEIPGISFAERRLTALLARYHRKSYPRTQHPEYTILTQEERNTVGKLSAILRLACGLAQHLQLAEKLQVRVEPSRVLLRSDKKVSCLPDQAAGLELEYFNDVFATHIIVQ